MIWIVLPTRNEAAIIRANLERLLNFLRSVSNYPIFHDREILDSRAVRVRDERREPTDDVLAKGWRVVVADNASIDATRTIVREIVAVEPRVELLEIPEAGKGGAVLAAWWKAASAPTSPLLRTRLLEGAARLRGARKPQAASNNAFVFMDADLATDLEALPALFAAIRSGADIAIGSRNLPDSRSKRGIGRRIISRCYRILLRLLFDLRVSDPPCGFKAVSERVVREIIPLVRDRQWFFDTELLIRAQRAGLSIVEVPVEWREPRHGNSLRKILRIIASDLQAMWQLLCERLS